MIKAVFSNGHEDIYKGSRFVAAAWMVVEKATGEVVSSGHSLTAEIAEKTGRNNIPKRYSGYTGRCGAWLRRELAKELQISPQRVPAYCNKVNAELKDSYIVEVVAL